MLRSRKIKHSTRKLREVQVGQVSTSPRLLVNAMLPEDQLIFLNDRIHSRTNQIRQIANLLDVRYIIYPQEKGY